ncbi:MAG: 6-bladed beta-propeller [Gemmatimonadales bacterium]|nr:6-bladed beta-propeller [Gemmatimonadales bacterium]MBP7620348.1 6-bladed beta-propeller [Gemmatimonadales bacterium]
MPTYADLARMLTALLLVAPISAQGTPRPVDSLVLERLTTYGPDAPHRSTATTSTGSEAPLIGLASTAAPGPGGRVYVLDQLTQSIYVYSASGTPERVIGRSGQGPGEFKMAFAFDVAADGRLAVLDDGLRRVTLFDAKDAVVATQPLGGSAAFGIVLGATGFDLLREFGRTTPTALEFVPTNGAAARRYLTPTPRDRAFARGGSPGFLARGIGNELLYFSGAPGTWAVIDAQHRVSARRGLELFPEADFVARDEGRGPPLLYTPAGVVGGGVVGSRIFIVHLVTSFASSTARQMTQSWGIALFDRDGTLRAQGTLPAEWGHPGRIHAGHGDTILIPFQEPEPHVRAVRLRVVPRRG